MNIGFDLDGIFINGPPFIPKSLVEWLYRGPQDHKPKYRFPATKLEQSLRKWSHSPSFRPVIYENVQVVRELSKTNNVNIYLVSSRYKFLKKETRSLLKKNGLDKCFSKIYLNEKNLQPHLFKKTVLENLNLDIFVEDDLIILKFIKNYFPKIVLLWYNPKRGIHIPDGIMQIKSLKEIYTYIK